MRSMAVRTAAGLCLIGLGATVAAPALLQPLPAAAQSALPPQTGKLAIDRILITEVPAKGYRDPALRQTSSVPADRELHIYVEPTGLATKFENGEVKAQMIIDLQLKSTAGKVIRDGKGLLKLPIAVKAQSHLPLKDIYTNIKLDPLKLAPGPYVLLVRVNDEFGRTATEKSIGFTQTPAQGAAPPTKK